MAVVVPYDADVILSLSPPACFSSERFSWLSPPKLIRRSVVLLICVRYCYHMMCSLVSQANSDHNKLLRPLILVAEKKILFSISHQEVFVVFSMPFRFRQGLPVGCQKRLHFSPQLHPQKLSIICICIYIEIHCLWYHWSSRMVVVEVW